MSDEAQRGWDDPEADPASDVRELVARMKARYDESVEVGGRYAEVRLPIVVTDTGPRPYVQMCLECGVLVGNEALHDGRCYGAQINADAEDMARAWREERIAEGEDEDLDEDDEWRRHADPSW